MKWLIMLIMIGISSGGNCFGKPFRIKNNTTFVYVVNKYEERYQLNIVIDHYNRRELKFHFSKTDPEYSKGYYSVSSSALDSAAAMTVLFKPGEKVLNNATACLFSRKAFNEIKEKGFTKLLIDGPLLVDFILLEPPYQLNFFDAARDNQIQIGKKKKSLNLLFLRSADLKNPIEMAVLNNRRHPWVFYVSIGEKMWLQEIRY
ncbi:MAG: hypothetical protein K1X55_04100 [Chitinophagales bacterium]|nr:hypothetical protein [Chitinophagales bacterium]